MMHGSRLSFLGAASALALAATNAVAAPAPGEAAPAAAEAPPTDTADAPGAAGDIVVTARRTNETLQNVPLSVTVFTADTLEKRGIDSALDLAAFTPNFHFYSANGRSDTSALFIRGLNANTTDARYQNVTFFIDGVPLSGTVMGLPTSNVSQIEIVKGPQSATFGKATYSGAVNYITANPTPTGLSGQFRGRYMNGADTAGSGMAAGRIEFPLVKDAVWLQLTGSYEKEGALYSDPATGQKIGQTQTSSAGALLYAEPTDGLTIKLRGQYEFDNDSAPALVLQGPREWARDGTLITLPSNILWSSKLSNPRPYAGCSGAGRAEIGHCGAERKRWVGALIVGYDIGEWHVGYLGGIGYQRGKALSDLYYASSADPLYADLPTPTKAATQFSDSGFKTTDTSHQLLLSTPTAGSFRARIGAGYFYDSILYYQTIGSGGVSTAANPNGKRQGKLWGRNIAAFGGADWDIVPALTLSGEARLERQTVAYDTCTVCNYNKTFKQRYSQTNFLPRITVKYKLAEENSLYALYSKGNRPARYNDTQSPAYPLAQAETLNNWEIGSKNYFFDRRLLLNVAGFYQKLKNQQYRTIVPGTSVQSIQNVAGSRVWGFEAETIARITPELSLSGGVGYANHKFTSSVSLAGTGAATVNLFPVGGANVLGLTSYNTPRWNGSASLDYKRRISDDYTLDATVDYSYTGKQFADLANVQIIDPASILNFRLALENSTYSVALLVKNLTGNNTPTGSNLGAIRTCLYLVPEYAAARQACNVAGMRRPREFGVEASVKF